MEEQCTDAKKMKWWEKSVGRDNFCCSTRRDT